MIEKKSLRLGEALTKAGLITPLQLVEALEAQKYDLRKIGEIIMEKGYATESQICETLSRMYSLPFVDLKTIHVKDEVFSVVDVDLIRRHHVYPLKIEGKVLTLAIHNPLEFSVIQEIQYVSGLQVKPVLATLSDIEKKLSHSYEAM